MNKIDEAVLRIKHMEELFNRLSETVSDFPAGIAQNEELRLAVTELSDYYSNGSWLSDYELDEQRLLPPELKRGVLSQDGLYDLLCELREVMDIE